MIRFSPKALFITAILFFTPVFAQFGGDEEDDPDEGIPIDSGIYFLAASGVLYAIYHCSRMKR